MVLLCWPGLVLGRDPSIRRPTLFIHHSKNGKQIFFKSVDEQALVNQQHSVQLPPHFQNKMNITTIILLTSSLYLTIIDQQNLVKVIYYKWTLIQSKGTFFYFSYKQKENCFFFFWQFLWSVKNLNILFLQPVKIKGHNPCLKKL